MTNAEAVGASARLALNRCENTFPPGDSGSSDAAGSSGNDISGTPADGDHLRSTTLEKAFERENTATLGSWSFPNKSPSLAIGWKLTVEIFPLPKENAPSRNIRSFRTASRFCSTSKTNLRESRETCYPPP
jgi:hypothetical protein